jgi:hypothetical protein
VIRTFKKISAFLSSSQGRSTFALVLLNIALAGATNAQEDTSDDAPPPLKIVSRAELSQLDVKSNIKDRTKLTLELMNLRLTAAEKYYEGEDFDGTYRELGVFHGLMDHGLAFLYRNNNGSDKILDNFKRIDIALRGFAPRIETIRREMPSRYENYVRVLAKYVREARTKATEPLFADTVVPQRRTSP